VLYFSNDLVSYFRTFCCQRDSGVGENESSYNRTLYALYRFETSVITGGNVIFKAIARLKTEPSLSLLSDVGYKLLLKLL